MICWGRNLLGSIMEARSGRYKSKSRLEASSGVISQGLVWKPARAFYVGVLYGSQLGLNLSWSGMETSLGVI